MTWQDWIGRSHRQTDILTPALVHRHRATLDVAPDNPAPLPGIHWVLNLPEATTADLGEDGHPRRDIANSFLPPIDLPRRMWASSEVEFLGNIPVGATVTRTSSIADIVEKSGSSGRLAFVTLDHATNADGVAVVREKQTLVYREAIKSPSPSGEGLGWGGSAKPVVTEAAPPPTRAGVKQPPAVSGHAGGMTDPDALKGRGENWPHHRTLTPTEALLFRFSALTFNTHRIHYDLPYARDVEGYKGLVVHGPLTATLLLNWASELFGPIRRFGFRAVAPVFAGEELTLVARQEGDDITLAALGPGGAQCVKAGASA